MIRLLRNILRIAVTALACDFAAFDAGADVAFYRLGETRIAVEILGQSGPAVVFVSGLGEGITAWDPVSRVLSGCARVILYDRPGIGRSSSRTGTSALLANAAVAELADLLGAIGASPPYVMVGHSLGGFYVQAFARNRPRDVAAVVLVDSSSPFEPPGVFVPTATLAPASAAAIEHAGFRPSVAAMLAGPPFPPVPLVVLVATNHGVTPEREMLWRKVQVEVAALSPKSLLTLVDGAGHYIQNDRPQAVVDAVVLAAREAGANMSECRTANSVAK